MSNTGYSRSFKEVTSHKAWVGFVPMKAAVEALNNTGLNFVISGGIRDNHYILTCKSFAKGAVCYHVRYDATLAGWKNSGCPVYSSLEDLVADHLDQAVVATSA